NWVFSRYFKDNKATAGVIAFAASLLIVFGIYKNGFDIESVFGDFGVTSDLFYTLLPLTVIAGIVFLIVKFKRKSLLIMGLLLFVLSILTYEKATLWLIGGILIIIWFFVREKGSSQNRTRTTHAG
ncbi:MAG: hypothetical protein Q8P15_02620, partial [Nanoarchaeota archaeon]|nr:hypothetical protein [Nanoarchaeota archaeon]